MGSSLREKYAASKKTATQTLIHVMVWCMSVTSSGASCRCLIVWMVCVPLSLILTNIAPCPMSKANERALCAIISVLPDPGDIRPPMLSGQPAGDPHSEPKPAMDPKALY